MFPGGPAQCRNSSTKHKPLVPTPDSPFSQCCGRPRKRRRTGGGQRRAIRPVQLIGLHDLTSTSLQHTETRACRTGDAISISGKLSLVDKSASQSEIQRGSRRLCLQLVRKWLHLQQGLASHTPLLPPAICIVRRGTFNQGHGRRRCVCTQETCVHVSAHLDAHGWK